jgi:hypothetical protein
MGSPISAPLGVTSGISGSIESHPLGGGDCIDFLGHWPTGDWEADKPTGQLATGKLAKQERRARLL